jgi:hypothetical protein
MGIYLERVYPYLKALEGYIRLKFLKIIKELFLKAP